MKPPSVDASSALMSVRFEPSPKVFTTLPSADCTCRSSVGSTSTPPFAIAALRMTSCSGLIIVSPCPMAVCIIDHGSASVASVSRLLLDAMLIGRS